MPESDLHGGSVARLDHVVAGYGASPVLRDLSLSLLPGEIYVLMGPNGAGKSTLIRVLTGVLKPSSGSVSLPSSGPAIRWVPQEIALYPWLSARENCLAFARIGGAGRAAAHALVERALILADCTNIADLPVSRLSGGYKRRVNIAAALIGEPKLLILDEPTVGIDRDAKQAITATILSLKSSLDAAILIVTHDFDDADALADRAGFLFGGSLIASGRPTDLIGAAFGAQKRIELSLKRPPDDLQRAALIGLGALPTLIDTGWVLFRDFDDWAMADSIASIQALGLDIAEVKMRNPGLEALYTRLGEQAA
jgi:ABC-2 type transport system ATP-binding protein